MKDLDNGYSIREIMEMKKCGPGIISKKNKFKMIKRVYRFFGGPKIRFKTNQFIKLNFIIYQNYILRKSGFYKNFNDFKSNHKGYNKIDINLNHKKYSKEINPKQHFKIVKNLKINLNPHYFKNLQAYGIEGIVFDRLYGKKIKNKYFLLPPNIVFLELISRINFEFLKNYKIVDIPSGLGNFLGYLNYYLPKSCIAGVDNFSQISRENVILYQKQTFGFDVVSNSNLKERIDYFIWIIGGLPISFLEKEIKKFKPKYLFLETINSQYTNELYLISNEYEVDFFNEIVIILKLKNTNSIEDYFIDY